MAPTIKSGLKMIATLLAGLLAGMAALSIKIWFGLRAVYQAQLAQSTISFLGLPIYRLIKLSSSYHETGDYGTNRGWICFGFMLLAVFLRYILGNWWRNRRLK